jgi:hypothetical protein
MVMPSMPPMWARMRLGLALIPSRVDTICMSVADGRGALAAILRNLMNRLP